MSSPSLKLVVSVALLAFLFSRIDTARLWDERERASLPWLATALAVYGVNVMASTWRWRLLLEAQNVHVPGRTLFGSFLVANFFNNFLPSNIGGDVIRIRDTRRTVAVEDARHDGRAGRSRPGPDGARAHRGARRDDGRRTAWQRRRSRSGRRGCGRSSSAALAIAAPAMLAPQGLGRLLQPLTAVHPEWVGGRIDTLTAALGRFREHPAALLGCFSGAVLVQGLMVAFYLAVVHALQHAHQPVGSGGHRAAVARRADAADFGQRLRRARSDLLVLLHAPRTCRSNRPSSCRSSPPRS